MTTLIAVFLPEGATLSLVREVWGAAGYTETTFPGWAGKEGRREAFSSQAYEHGVVLEAYGGIDEEALRGLAEAIIAGGASLVVIDSDIEATWVTEWDGDGRRRQEVPNPDWAAKEARREEPGERIAHWQLEEVAESRLGARRGTRQSLYFRLAPLEPIDEVLRAIDAGAEVVEVVLNGRSGLRFAAKGAVRTVFLSTEETDSIRAKLARPR
jgi:hypothetical protein